jgi:hypothetical protein
MFNLTYLYMCLFIGTYLYFYGTGAPFPEFLRSLNGWVCWAFLLWGGYQAGSVIVDCLVLSSKDQMTPSNARDGILLALISYLPTLMISIFMLREGFMER